LENHKEAQETAIPEQFFLLICSTIFLIKQGHPYKLWLELHSVCLQNCISW